MRAAAILRAPERPRTNLDRAGWASREQWEEFRSIRVRFTDSSRK
jgi:hypothetical protein